MNTCVRFTDLPADLQKPVEAYCADIGLSISPKATVAVACKLGDRLAVEGTAEAVTVTYRRKCELFRALSYLPTFLKDGKPVQETGRYRLLSYMGDCSRNAVFNLPFAKQMIRNLAGMGYSSMMLYMEDTYELPGYPYFGHMRGRFTADELRELDDYADSFGLELIPCIQTLAHLATTIRWPDFQGYTDTNDILLVGDDRTYAFAKAAIQQCASCFRTRRINLGMDEAHDLGCGNYLRKNGYRKPSEIMLEHLNRVVEICREIGVRPMIWSDMFFRMAFGTYYVREGEISQEVMDRVPEGLELVYWDYYTMDRERCEHMMKCHKSFHNNVLFAGGAWKWHGFGAHNAFSIKSSKIQLDACEKYGVDEIIVTGWGDNGGEASQVSSLASILYFAERCYHGENVDTQWLDLRSKQCFATSIEDLLAFDLPNALTECSVEKVDHPCSPAKYLLFNDPLERLEDRHMVRETVRAEYEARAQKLLSISDNPRFGYCFEALGKLCAALAEKATLGWQLYDAYQAGDCAELDRLAKTVIPNVIGLVDEFLVAFRKQWYHENKTFGFSTQEIRIGGLKERLHSTALRVEAYLSGEVDRIEELEQAPLAYLPKMDGTYNGSNTWRQMVSPGIL